MDFTGKLVKVRRILPSSGAARRTILQSLPLIGKKLSKKKKRLKIID